MVYEKLCRKILRRFDMLVPVERSRSRHLSLGFLYYSFSSYQRIVSHPSRAVRDEMAIKVKLRIRLLWRKAAIVLLQHGERDPFAFLSE